ncbi:DprA-like winged helix domain-containing protein [Paragemmobacter ruber]|uniref:DprA-like winged helix domain-containing protein n=1 Tax=Paragemmobacter ruber TaxID=1985673 RepID=UPI0037429FFA
MGAGGIVLDGAAMAGPAAGAGLVADAGGGPGCVSVAPVARSAVVERPGPVQATPVGGGASGGSDAPAAGAGEGDGRPGGDRSAVVAARSEARARPGDQRRGGGPVEAAASDGVAAAAPEMMRSDAGRSVTDRRPLAETTGLPSGSVGAAVKAPAMRPVSGLAGTLPGPVPATRSLAETAVLHRMILDRLGPNAVPEDQLIRDLDLPTETVARELVALEVEGQVLRHAGGLLSRC